MTTRTDPNRTGPSPRGAVLLGPAPRSADREPERRGASSAGQLEAAVDQALEHAQLEDVDQAAAQLARDLARRLDRLSGPKDAAQLGRTLAGVLDQLGMTPAARKSVDEQLEERTESNPVDRIRAAADRRLRAVEGGNTDG